MREFKDLRDLKEFAEFLSLELTASNREDLALEVNEFTHNSYTTSSEYLGEYRIVLRKVLSEVDIDVNQDIKQNILLAIKAINKAFEIS